MNETRRAALQAALDQLPLVAILRGVEPEEVDAVFDALVVSGFRLIEVPLNSPRPWESLARLAGRCPNSVVLGAGTVLDIAHVEQLATLDAPLLITPNTEVALVRRGSELGLAPMIGCMTPSEALAALGAGALALKLFPATRLGVGYFSDLKAVLPTRTPVLAVGGIHLGNMAEWHAAGIGGFGFGSNLYKPGRSPREVAAVADDLVAEWRRLAGASGSESKL